MGNIKLRQNRFTVNNISNDDKIKVYSEARNDIGVISLEDMADFVGAYNLIGSNYNGVLNVPALTEIPERNPANGDWYFVGAEGTLEGIELDVHDILKYNGSAWERVPRGDAVTADSRQSLLSTNVGIAGGAEQASADPLGQTPGWYYRNSTGGKINWYFYAGSGNYTETNLGNLRSMWAVVNLVNGYCYLTAYTKPDGVGDASWYKSRLTWDDDSGQLLQNKPDGKYLIYVGEEEDLASVRPDILPTNRIPLPVSSFSTVGQANDDEDIWLLALSTSSGFAEGHNEFIVEEVGYQFGMQKHTLDLVGVPAQDPEIDPLFSASFKGNFANAAALPAAVDGQWAINDEKDSIWVYDGTNGWTEAAGEVEQAAPGVAANPYVFVYSANDNTGYGYMDATSRNGNNYWNNTPDGMLQTTGGAATNYNRVKFATLKNPGDEVYLDGIPLQTSYMTRYAMVGLTPGVDPDDIFIDANKDIGSGTSYYGQPSTASQDGIELHNCFVNPYVGTASYAGNMRRVNGSGNPYFANLSQASLGYRVAADYHIEFLMDGVVVGKTVNVPAAGVDLYLLSPQGRRFPQPTGTIMETPNNPLYGPATKYWMSTNGNGGNLVAAGSGYFLYSNQTAGNSNDIELTAEEANSAASARVFVDYTGKTIEERAELTQPIVDADQQVLAEVTRLVRGYFHSLDLTVPEISGKMATYGDALAAAAAGSVELTLALMASITDPAEAEVVARISADLSLHLAKFPR